MIKHILGLALILVIHNGHGQIQDAELWTGIGIKAKVVKKLSADLMVQTRFNQNASQLKTGFVQLATDYEVLPDLDLGVSYRWSERNRLSHFETANRVCLNLAYQYKLKDLGLRFKLRGRYQYVFDRLMAVNDYILPEDKTVYRLKLALSYKNKALKGLRPFINSEVFYNTDLELPTPLIAYRLSGGLDYKMSKRHSLRARYIYEKNQGLVPQVNHIYGLTYQYNLKGKLFN